MKDKIADSLTIAIAEVLRDRWDYNPKCACKMCLKYPELDKLLNEYDR